MPKSFALPGLLLAALLCSSVAHGQNANASRYYEDALRRYEAKDLAGSILQLKNALQINREMLPAQLLLGKAALESGDPVAAELAFGEALRLGGSRGEIAPQLALALLQLGRHGALLSDSRLQPAGLTGNALYRLLLVRASAQGDAGDGSAAMSTIEQARSVDPRSPDSWLAEVGMRIRLRQLDRAEEAMKKALALAPNSADVHNQNASLAHVSGRLTEAMAHYAKALQIDPLHRDARMARAALALERNEMALVRDDLRELQARHPSNPRVAYLRALLAAHDGDTAGAQAALRQVTEQIDPIPIDVVRFRTQLLLLAGMAHHALNQTEKAKPYLEMVTRQLPNSPTAKLLAQTLFDEGQIENGIQLLETYLRSQPRDGQALALLASGHTMRGRHAKAMAIMEEALRAGDDDNLRGVLGLSLLRAGRYANAQTELEAVHKRAPTLEQPAFSLAMLYLRTQQSAKAVTIARQLTRQRPANASYQHLLGLALSSSGQAAEARKAYETALKLDPELLNAQLSLARLDAQQGQWAQAEQRLIAQNRKHPSSVEVLLELAKLTESRGRLADAERWLENAIAAASTRELRPLVSMVTLRLRQRNPDGALEASRQLIAKAPEDLVALITHARTQIAVGQGNAARSTLVNASRRAGYEAEPLIEIAGLQVQLGDLGAARHTLEKAQQAKAPPQQLLGLLATVNMREGQVAEAQAQADKLLASAPRAATSHLLLADLAMIREQPPQALLHLRKAHEVDPSTATLMRLFQHLVRFEGPDSALKLADAWLRQQPKDRLVLRAQADLYGATKQWAASKNAYEKLLRLQADDAEAHNNLANAQIQLGDKAGAVRSAEQALKLRPGWVAAIDTLAWSLHKMGQHERALGLLREARSRAPELAELRYHLAAVLAALGRKDEARNEVRAALANRDSLSSVQEAQALATALN